MGNSAFEQKQTGNASETAAGSVEEATAAEVAAKTDTGATGAKLFVPPSKLPSGGDLDMFNAYEDLVAGDAVGISHWTPSTAIFTPSFTRSYYNDVSATIWYAQRFNFPATGVQDITKVMLLGLSTAAASVRVRVRATLTGADIVNTVASIGYGTVWTMQADTTGLLTPGNDYYILVEWISGAKSVSYDATGGSTPPGVTGDQSYKSTDSGASWTPEASDLPLEIRIEGPHNSALGHYEVFKSSAEATYSNRLGFSGYAKEAATAGNPVTVVQSRATQVHTGLTSGRKYYLSDTPGEISLTPGTLRIELGRAQSATQLVRDGAVAGIPFSLPSNTQFFYGNAIVYGGDTGVVNTRIYDRIDSDAGETDYIRSSLIDAAGQVQGLQPRAGDKIVFEGGTDYRFMVLKYPE